MFDEDYRARFLFMTVGQGGSRRGLRQQAEPAREITRLKQHQTIGEVCRAGQGGIPALVLAGWHVYRQVGVSNLNAVVGYAPAASCIKQRAGIE